MTVDDELATAVLGKDRWHRAFIAFVSVGIVLAAVLGIREVVSEPVIQLDDVRGSEEDVVPPQAQVLARNTSEHTTYCVEVTISATDRGRGGDDRRRLVGAGAQRQLHRQVRRFDRTGDRRGARRLLRLRDRAGPMLSCTDTSLTLLADLACLVRRVYSSTREPPKRGRAQ